MFTSDFCYLFLQTAGIAVLIGVYLKWKQIQNFWKIRGVHQMKIPPGWNLVKPQPLFGDASFDGPMYKQLKEEGLAFGGYFEFLSPVIFVRDLDLLKHLFVKDFEHFTDHRPHKFPRDPTMENSLFFLRGDPWRNLRHRMTPTFTTGKLKSMFNIMDESSQKFMTVVKNRASVNPKIEVRDLIQRVLLDIIVRIAFGVQSDIFENDNSKFLAAGHAFNGILGGWKRIKLYLSTFAPQLVIPFPFLGLFDSDAAPFLTRVLKNSLAERRQKGIVGNDFLQVMLQAQKELREAGSDFQISDDLINAQSQAFINGGFDTVETLLVWATHMLAQHPEEQQRAYEEVKAAYDKNGCKLDYELVNGLGYLENVCSETLRIFVAIPRTERYCTKEYHVPNSEIVIPAGTTVVIPIEQIHKDAAFWDEPEKFKPERFNKENSASRHICSYLPFGVGPRQCIGMRFGIIQSKLILARLLLNFKIEHIDSNAQAEYGKNGFFKPNNYYIKVHPRV